MQDRFYINLFWSAHKWKNLKLISSEATEKYITTYETSRKKPFNDNKFGNVGWNFPSKSFFLIYELETLGL